MTLKINLNLLQDNNGVAGEPLTQDQITVNDSFFVEVEVADIRDNSAGVIGLALDIAWDAAILEALDTQITEKLPLNPQGVINNENGLIDDLGAGAIPNFNLGEAVGVNQLERFALLHFQGEIVTENAIPLTVTISDPRNVAFADGTPFDGETDIEAQTLEVTPENTPPTLVNQIEDLTTAEDSEFSFTIPDNIFQDPDEGDSLTYTATLEDGSDLPDWLAFDAETKTFSGMPANSDVGSLEVEVTVTDSGNDMASDIFTLTVENVDDAPSIQNAIVDLEVDEDADNSAIDLSNTFSDVDNDNNAIVKTVLTNSNEDLVTASIDGNELTIDYQDNQSGRAEITIEAESNGKTITDTFEVTVNPVDDPPIVSNPIDNVEVNENAESQTIDLSSVFNDLDGDEITFEVKTNSNEDLVATSLDGNDLTLDFQDDQFGEAEITIEAIANGEMVSDTFNVIVNEVIPENNPPTLVNEIEDLKATEDSEFSFTIPNNIFQDSDEGDSLTYSAMLADGSDLPDWLAFNPDTKTFSGTPKNSDVGSLDLKVTVTDNDGETASDIFTLTVENVDDAPVVNNEIADIEVNEDADNSKIDLSDTFSDVDNDDSAIVKTVLTNSNEELVTATIDGNELTLDYQDNQSGTAEITIQAESNEKTVTDTFEVTVNPVDDVIATEDSEFSFTVPENTFKEVDTEDTAAYSVTLENGDELPNWLTFNVNTQTFSGIPTNNDVGTLNIKVTATDNTGKIASYSFLLTIDDFENHNPEADNDTIVVLNRSDLTIINVLDNDIDADSDDLTIDEITTKPENGTVNINGDGTISYTSDLGFSGVDSFDYQVSDGNGGTDIATVNVEVQPLVTIPEMSDGMLYDTTPVGDDSLTTTLSEDILDLGTDAEFDNLVGFYEVTGTDGGIDINGDGVEDLLPSDAGYAQSALSNSIPGWQIRAGSSGDLSKNTTVEQFGDVVIAGGKTYAPFVIAHGGEIGIDGFVEAEASETDSIFNDAATHINDMVAYFAFLGANPDNAIHLQAFGDGVFGFEDLPANLADVESDNDFNDAIFQFIFDM